MRSPRAWLRTLRRTDTRAALVLSALLLLVLGMQALALYAFLAMESLEEADLWMENANHVVRRAATQTDSLEREVAEVRGDSPSDVAPSVRLVDAHGAILAAWGDWPQTGRMISAVPGDDGRNLSAALLLRPGNHLLGAVEISAGGSAQIALPLSHFASELWEVGQGLALAALLSGLAGLGIAILATTRAFAPLRHATRLIQDVDAQTLGRRLPSRQTGDPVDRHAETLNSVLASIDASFSRLRDFSSDVAHELRTPLHRIGNLAEVALLGDDDEQLRSALEGIRRTAEELAPMVQALLLLAEIDERRIQPQPTELELKDWIGEVAEIYAPLFEEQEIELEIRIEPGRLRGDRLLLDRVLLNLLDNALRYTGAAARVEISARRSPTGATITVDDSGPGIPADQRERVFDRFARLNPARNAPGSGLGLALARAIARLHCGDLRVETSHLGGARFVWELPDAGKSPDRSHR